MTNTSIVEQIFEYRNQSPNVKLAEHLDSIPQREDKMIIGQVYYYENPDSRLRTAVDFMKDFCIELDYVQIRGLFPKEYKVMQESVQEAQEMIEKGYIHPFCLIVNDKFIPWKYIKIICVTEKYYMLVHDMNPTIFENYFFGTLNKINMIRLPQDITYTDDEGGETPIDDRTIFAFDEEGNFVSEGTAYYLIQSDDDDLVIVEGICGEDHLFKISEDLKYSYFPEFIFTFTLVDNKYTYDDLIEISTLGSYARIGDAGEDTYVKAFYSTRHTPIHDNMYKVNFDSVQSDIIRTLSGAIQIPSYLNILSQAFDVPFDIADSFEENKANALDYIANYDSRLFNEYYKTKKKFIVRHVDYDWVMTHRDRAGNLRIPRKFTLHHNFYIIVFVNGELFINNGLSRYEGPEFVMPVDGLESGDSIEIWYFIGAKNYEYDMVIDPDQPYLPLDQDFFYIPDDMAIYSNETKVTNFTYPADGLQNFKVDYTLEKEDDRLIRVRFDNTYYYSKNLTMTSANRFAHHTAYIDTTGQSEYANYFKIDLGEDFKFCNEYDRYLVFYNGRRLSNDQYRLVLPNSDGYPFYRYQVYIGKPMKRGDYVDVIYLPHYCLDLDCTDANFTADGLLTIPKDKIWAALDNEIYTYWLNGKKIDQDDIMPIGENSVALLSNPDTKKDLRITLMLQYDEEYDELSTRFQTYTSAWDQVLARKSFLNLLDIPSISYTDNEATFFTNGFPIKALMKELIRDWYIGNPYVDCTSPIYYKYGEVDSTMIEDAETDSAGMTLIEVADSSTSDNLDVSRPYS